MPQGMDHLPQFFEKPLIVICNPATSGQGSGQLRPSSMESNDLFDTGDPWGVSVASILLVMWDVSGFEVLVFCICYLYAYATLLGVPSW